MENSIIEGRNINEATVLSIRRLRGKGESWKEIADRHSMQVPLAKLIYKNGLNSLTSKESK